MKGLTMQQQVINNSEINYQAVENDSEQYPWFFIQPENTRVRYRHNWIAVFYGLIPAASTRKFTRT